MPLKKYSKGRKFVKRVKRTSSRRLPTMKRLSSMIKKISLKQCETKNTHQIEEDIDIYHNKQSLKTNLLYTRQGIGDVNSGTSSYATRLGDKVVARGLQFKFWFANVSDRPNVMYRVIIFKYFSQSTPPTTIFKSQGSSNIMIRDIDTEKVKIVKVKQFNLQVGTSFAPNDGTGFITASDLKKKEAHRYLKVYVPLRNKQIQYIGDDNGTPRNYDYGYCVCAYDSYGTLEIDIVGTYASNVKFYFKDP